MACSGKYEVGGMGQGGAGDGEAGSSTVAGSAPIGGSVPAGGTSAGGSAPVDPYLPGELGSSCVPVGQPEALAGPFVDGATLWGRIAPLLWDGVPLTPSPLPAQIRYDQVEPLVRQAIDSVRAEAGGLPGARRFVARWLAREGEAELTLKADWAALLAKDEPALPLLLQTQLGGPGEVGVFTEPEWLARHASISSRGGAISYSLFQQGPPPPPPGTMFDFEPDPILSDRDALNQQVVDVVCAACHRLIDPLGFPLGHFDRAGKYRELDHGQPPDLSGSYQGVLTVEFDGPMDFGVKVADTCVANRALAGGMLRYASALRQLPLAARDELVNANLDRVAQAFIRSGRSYPDLVVAYAQSPLALRQ